MLTRVMCSWCHTMTSDRDCPECEHRAELARMDCDCPRCRRFERPKDATGELLAVGSRVEFLEPHQGFPSGTVGEILRGVMGPVAGVIVEPGRTVDTLCRRLRKVCE